MWKLSDMRTHVGSHILLMLRSSSENDQGLEVMGSNPCGWCGRDSSVGGCWTWLVLDPKGIKQPRTESNCDYHYGGMRYSAAAAFSTSSPCTNVPLHCQICAKILWGEQRTFWKYNAMYHMLLEHSSEEAGQEISLPEVPLEFILSMFTSRKEETALGVDEHATKDYQETYGLPMSDDLENLEYLACKRALSCGTDSEHVNKHR
ncbi:hypothetical protein FB446DRAFT_651953 [Lentinula raphanica]|nr:hypothetical protein FB446DRAFT_651953 [Lentinula raphanica]